MLRALGDLMPWGAALHETGLPHAEHSRKIAASWRPLEASVVTDQLRSAGASPRLAMADGRVREDCSLMTPYGGECCDQPTPEYWRLFFQRVAVAVGRVREPPDETWCFLGYAVHGV